VRVTRERIVRILTDERFVRAAESLLLALAVWFVTGGGTR
jgi:hypothetical protein